ncbi:MAG TPA: HEXXH motif-containing putative peptide modification protein [Micromonosporaceae bacterium]|nr:HEXXH motif-containing putative peptide modification protein [Micromonosporaceae bacterium]
MRTVVVATPQGAVETALDDLDRYRDCHGHPPADRLGDEAWRVWRGLITTAWDLLSAYAPDRATDLAAGLTSIVPLRTTTAATGLSATCGDAFGGFGATVPADGAECASTMVHEFSHSKLNALHELVPLYRADDGLRYFAPWRPDPRPVGGLLQGAHAFTAVADLWCALRADRALEARATTRFAVLRAQLRRALPDLLGAPGLTDAGRCVAQCLAGEVRLFDHMEVPARVEREAHRRLADSYRSWCRRNGADRVVLPQRQPRR